MAWMELYIILVINRLDSIRRESETIYPEAEIGRKQKRLLDRKLCALPPNIRAYT